LFDVFLSWDDFWNSVFNVMKSITWRDFVDIAIVTFVIYSGFKLIRETRAGQLLKGIGFLIIAYLISNISGFKVLQFVLKNVLSIGALAVIIIFQVEIRRILEKFGQTTSGGFFKMQNTAIDEICTALGSFSRTFTGALIVIEVETKLGEQVATGTELNAKITSQLLENIFFKNTPLHDGAVIIRDGIILAAACHLPLSHNDLEIDKALGTRHRAAIGMSENSDAIIIIVSEETGYISIANNGSIERNLTVEYVKFYLTKRILPGSTKKKAKYPQIAEDIDVHSNIDFNK
jgi:diadenylate cyclase